MKKTRKILAMMACAVLLVCISVGATVAYLTSEDTVTNTFTVGKVAITLDEAKVNEAGKPVDQNGNEVEDVADAPRVDNNSYHLYPGHNYTKDPTVTVKAGSDDAYIYMTVTVNKSKELDKLFSDKKLVLTNVVKGYNASDWTYEGTDKDAENNTRTYMFFYKTTVNTLEDADKVLEPLFTNIEIPETLDNDEMATIAGLTITVNAYAVQADGFENAIAAYQYGINGSNPLPYTK